MGRRPEPVEVGPVRASTTLPEQRGDGRWYWRARATPDRRTVWSGWATREEVAVALARLVAEGLPSRQSDPAGARTVAEVLAMWAEEQRQRAETGQIAPATLSTYTRGAAYWVAPIGAITPAALTRARVVDVTTTWLREGLSQRTAAHAVLVLRMALAWAHERGAPRPPDLDRLVRVDRDAHTNNAATPTVDEAEALLDAMPPGRGRDLVELLARTGCRVGEAAAAHVGDYDRATGTLTLHGRDEDRGRRGKVRPRRWPAQGELRALLDRLTAGRPADARLVAGLPIQPAAVAAAALEQAARATGLPVYTAHGLRRMVAMALLDAGVDARTVSELTGHSVAVLLGTYVRPTADRLAAAVSRLGAAPRVIDMRRRREEG